MSEWVRAKADLRDRVQSKNSDFDCFSNKEQNTIPGIEQLCDMKRSTVEEQKYICVGENKFDFVRFLGLSLFFPCQPQIKQSAPQPAAETNMQTYNTPKKHTHHPPLPKNAQTKTTPFSHGSVPHQNKQNQTYPQSGHSDFRQSVTPSNDLQLCSFLLHISAIVLSF